MLPSQRFARSTALFISLITLSFLLMTFDVRTEGGGVTGTLRDGVRTLFDPVQSAVTAVIRPVADTVDALVNLAGLRAENDRLREDLEDANRVKDAVKCKMIYVGGASSNADFARLMESGDDGLTAKE